MRALKGLAPPRASYSGEIAWVGSRRQRSTLVAVPFHSTHAVVTVARNSTSVPPGSSQYRLIPGPLFTLFVVMRFQVTSFGMMGLDMGWAPNVPFARVPLVVGIGAITDKVIPVNGAPAVRT